MIDLAVPQRVRTTSFPALGTVVQVWSPAADVLGGDLQALVAAYERRFSRFQRQSEVERVSARSGQEVPVSPELFDLLELAMSFWHETDGVFDPLIRPQLEAAGYDRTFDALPPHQPGASLPSPVRRPAFGAVELDAARRHACLPKGSSLDLGGIAKGWIIDRLAGVLAEHGPFLVDIGGDMAARGEDTRGDPGWLLAVEDPRQPERDRCWVRLEDTAIATSTSLRRRWRRGGRWLHHLIDPRTGTSAEGRLVQVTVIARTATAADVYAKTALILGTDDGLAWLTGRSLPAALITAGGELVRTPQWHRVEVPMTVS